jgi:hypothetical protein
LLYKRPDISGCYTSAVKDLKIGTIQALPNPAFNWIQLLTENEESIRKVLILNSLGSPALDAENIKDAHPQIDISKLPSGFYTGLVYFENGEIKAFKVAISK